MIGERAHNLICASSGFYHIIENIIVTMYSSKDKDFYKRKSFHFDTDIIGGGAEQHANDVVECDMNKHGDDGLSCAIAR